MHIKSGILIIAMAIGASVALPVSTRAQEPVPNPPEAQATPVAAPAENVQAPSGESPQGTVNPVQPTENKEGSVNPDASPATDAAIQTAPPKKERKSLKDTRAGKKAKKGAIWGAILGGVAGLALGGDAKSAAIGAAAGAAIGGGIGFAIGKHQDKVLASRDEVIKEIFYNPSQGDYYKLESVQVSPSVAKPGEEVTITATYLAIPTSEKETPVLAYQHGMVIQGESDYVFQDGPFPAKDTPKGGGRIVSNVPFKLDKKTPDGTYELIYLVQVGKDNDSKGWSEEKSAALVVQAEEKTS